MKVRTIEVTQEDIEQGERLVCNACPVARAIQRHLASGWTVSVSTLWIYIYREGERFGECQRSPQSVREFIERHDHNLPVEPISFALDLPEERLR